MTKIKGWGLLVVTLWVVTVASAITVPIELEHDSATVLFEYERGVDGKLRLKKMEAALKAAEPEVIVTVTSNGGRWSNLTSWDKNWVTIRGLQAVKKVKDLATNIVQENPVGIVTDALDVTEMLSNRGPTEPISFGTGFKLLSSDDSDVQQSISALGLKVGVEVKVRLHARVFGDVIQDQGYIRLSALSVFGSMTMAPYASTSVRCLEVAGSIQVDPTTSLVCGGDGAAKIAEGVTVGGVLRIRNSGAFLLTPKSNLSPVPVGILESGTIFLESGKIAGVGFVTNEGTIATAGMSEISTAVTHRGALIVGRSGSALLSGANRCESGAYFWTEQFGMLSFRGPTTLVGNEFECRGQGKIYLAGQIFPEAGCAIGSKIDPTTSVFLSGRLELGTGRSILLEGGGTSLQMNLFVVGSGEITNTGTLTSQDGIALESRGPLRFKNAGTMVIRGIQIKDAGSLFENTGDFQLGWGFFRGKFLMTSGTFTSDGSAASLADEMTFTGGTMKGILSIGRADPAIPLIFTVGSDVILDGCSLRGTAGSVPANGDRFIFFTPTYVVPRWATGATYTPFQFSSDFAFSGALGAIVATPARTAVYSARYVSLNF